MQLPLVQRLKLQRQRALAALDTGAERRGARTNVEYAAILRRNGFDVIDETVGSRPMTFGVRRNP